MRAFLFVLFLVCCAPFAFSQTISSVTVEETKEKTTITLRADQKLSYSQSSTTKPPGLLLTFDEASLSPRLSKETLVDNGSVRRLQWSQSKGLTLTIELEVELLVSVSAQKESVTIEVKKQRSLQTPPLIRVEILSHQKKVSLGASGAFSILEADTNEVLVEEAKGFWKLSSAKGKVIVTSPQKKVAAKAARVWLTPKNSERLITKGNEYRGSFLVQPNDDGTLSVINTLDLESYLYGVVPREMPAGWPKEALAAQAIAARTYALSRLGWYEAEGFDVKDTTQDQVYGGASAEQKKSTEAVDLTRGITAVDLDGKRINALYFSTAGGSTEDNDFVFEQTPAPYLRAVKTSWDEDSPHQSWSLTRTQKQLEEALNAQEETKVGTLQSITPKEKGSSGRWGWVELVGSEGTKTVRAHSFRRAIGAGKLKSTLFTMTLQGDSYAFEGRGYGHGVGMCQYSAKGMAAEGRSHREILRTFYGEGTRLFIEY